MSPNRAYYLSTAAEVAPVPAPADGERLCNKAEAQQVLGVSASTIARLLASGALPAVRIGRAVRIRLADLHRFAASLPAATYPGRG